MSHQYKNESPLVSIVLPVYNGAAFLERSIQSCLCQTYSNLELIIVNDASTDDSLKIANHFASLDSRICVITNQLNMQLPASLNIGHRGAKGDFITWTSHDNYFEDNAVELLLKVMLNSDADIVYSNVRIIDANGEYRKNLCLGDASSLLFGNAIGACFLYKKEVYIRNNGYDENLHTVEDYDFWLRASLHSSFDHIDKVLYNFRSHEQSLSSRLNVPESSENERFRRNLKKSYLNFLQFLRCKNKEDYAENFSKIHRHKKMDITAVLENYRDIERVLQEVAIKTQSLNLNKMVQELDRRIRSNIYRFPENHNFRMLWLLLSNRPAILFKYDRKISLRIILKCFN